MHNEKLPYPLFVIVCALLSVFVVIMVVAIFY